MKFSKKTLALIGGLIFGLTTNAHSAIIQWDLETIPVTFSTTSVSQTVGGVTLTITRPGSTFGIDDISGFFGVPPTWMDRSLSPFIDTSAISFIGNFSTTVSNVSIEFGDFTPSDLDSLTISGYSGSDGTGTLLGSITSPPCCAVGSGFQLSTLLLPVTGINSIRFIGGSIDFPNSVYYDNFKAETDANAVPEPASLALVGLGLLGLGAARRRNSLAGKNA